MYFSCSSQSLHQQRWSLHSLLSHGLSDRQPDQQARRLRMQLRLEASARNTTAGPQAGRTAGLNMDTTEDLQPVLLLSLVMVGFSATSTRA